MRNENRKRIQSHERLYSYTQSSTHAYNFNSRNTESTCSITTKKKAIYDEFFFSAVFFLIGILNEKLYGICD